MKKLIMSLFGAVLCGCATFESAPDPVIAADGTQLYRIPGVEAIDIPCGLSDKAVLDVVERIVGANNDGARQNRWKGQWRMENRDPANKWIQTGFSVREHYMCVCYRIEGGRLIPDVPRSTNLKQNGCSIHRKVPVWINGIRPQIAQGLYEASKGTSK